jgi:UV DNA damage endonuclease
MFLQFLNEIKGSVPEIHCMIEAKKKDAALFQLVQDMHGREGIKMIDQSSFLIE